MKSSTRALVAFLATACAGAIALPAVAGAKTVPSDLRVVTASGKTLADHIQYTGPTKVKTSKKANCFGSPASGDSHKLGDANALGLLADAARARRALNPLLITDAFFADFGSMGVCGVGGKKAPFVPFDPDNPKPTPFWYLAHDGEAASVGPNQLGLKAGDDVLYYLTEGTEGGNPDQLALDVPVAVSGKQVKVTVRVVDSGSGKAKPAAGAKVGGETTDKSGKATITLADEPQPGGRVATRIALQATRGQDVPSSREIVCVRGGCDGVGELILGSPKRDQIKGTALADKVKAGGGKDDVDAGAGDDRVSVKGGGRDSVDCGSGNDTVKADRKDKVRNCEQVRRS